MLWTKRYVFFFFPFKNFKLKKPRMSLHQLPCDNTETLCHTFRTGKRITHGWMRVETQSGSFIFLVALRGGRKKREPTDWISADSIMLMASTMCVCVWQRHEGAAAAPAAASCLVVSNILSGERDAGGARNSRYSCPAHTPFPRIIRSILRKVEATTPFRLKRLLLLLVFQPRFDNNPTRFSSTSSCCAGLFFFLLWKFSRRS